MKTNQNKRDYDYTDDYYRSLEERETVKGPGVIGVVTSWILLAVIILIALFGGDIIFSLLFGQPYYP